MDINLVRSLITAAWSKGKREDFEAAARLPLEDDLAEERMAGNGRGRQ